MRDATARVTTTDWWKLAGLALVLIDHYGLVFDPATEGWRVVGRLAAPIFFFMIGFARTRAVPSTWLVFGLVLTAVDAWTSRSGLGKLNLNILINFAWIRLVRPYAERGVLGHPWRIAAAALAITAMIAPMRQVLEYGAEGWLWALLGAVHRDVLDSGRGTALRNGLATYAGLVYAWTEIADYAFEGLEAAALVPLVAVLVVMLTRFERREARLQPPAALVPATRFCGRRSLEIYALTLLAMQLIGYALGTDTEAGEEEDG